MSCYNCTAKYNWRRKELECNNCHKSICKECLNKKIIIPKFGNKETLVCPKCFINLKKEKETATVSTSGQNEPPMAYDEPSIYFGPSMRDIVTSKDTKETNDPDVKLRERLKQLKEETAAPPPPSLDVEEQFRKVTGRDAASAAGGHNINTPKPKLTEAEEVLKLLEQTGAEVSIDDANAQSTKEKINDMEHRLMKLKGLDPENVKEKPTEYLDSSSEDEDEAINKIIKKCTLVPPNNPGETTSFNFRQQQEVEEEEEFPWCCICNDDAVIRCHGCDDDLYCRRCFRECHDDYDTKGHSKSPYKAKSKT